MDHAAPLPGRPDTALLILHGFARLTSVATHPALNAPGSLYFGSQVALATRHGKERVIGRALRHGLGAQLLHLAELDTDQLGSFCGSVPRLANPLETCRAKAELALQHGGTGLAVASEGSFGPHPALPLLAVGLECMVFVDAHRQLMISEQLLARRTNFGHLCVPAWSGEGGALPEPLRAWLPRVGFPNHALLVRPAGTESPGTAMRKGIRDLDALAVAVREAAAASGAGQAQLETDMRAHCNPTRMASIRELSFRLVRRLRQVCPVCDAPGWGLVGREPGLPCGWCGAATELSRWELFGCQRCGERRRSARADGLQEADPGHCSHCNP